MRRKTHVDNPYEKPPLPPPQMDLIRAVPTGDGKVVYQAWFESPITPPKPKVEPEKEIPFYRSGDRLSYTNGWRPTVYLKKLDNAP